MLKTFNEIIKNNQIFINTNIMHVIIKRQNKLLLYCTC